jgi:acetoin utilization protein AcuB
MGNKVLVLQSELEDVERANSTLRQVGCIGVRIAALVSNIPGKLAQLTKAIFDIGGNVVALGTFLGDSSENLEVCIKVACVDARALEETLGPFVEKIIDIRESQWA